MKKFTCLVLCVISLSSTVAYSKTGDIIGKASESSIELEFSQNESDYYLPEMLFFTSRQTAPITVQYSQAGECHI